MVTMYTTPWCGYCIRLKSQLKRAGVPFQEVNIEKDPQAAAFVGSLNGGNHVVPTLVLPDGTAMTNPSVHQVLSALNP